MESLRFTNLDLKVLTEVSKGLAYKDGGFEEEDRMMGKDHRVNSQGSRDATMAVAGNDTNYEVSFEKVRRGRGLDEHGQRIMFVGLSSEEERKSVAGG